MKAGMLRVLCPHQGEKEGCSQKQSQQETGADPEACFIRKHGLQDLQNGMKDRPLQ
jgi:hypothetical protein